MGGTQAALPPDRTKTTSCAGPDLPYSALSRARRHLVAVGSAPRPSNSRGATEMDRISQAVRSRNMARIRGRDTLPELKVRRALHARGFRYRVHRRDLPGRPDLVFPRYGIAVLVHGCFWHGHDCRRGTRPASNRDFWDAKLDANVTRDRRAERDLIALGWTVRVIWQCELEDGIARLVSDLERRRGQLASEPTR